MAEKYAGKLHLLKTGAKERWEQAGQDGFLNFIKLNGSDIVFVI